MAEDAFDPGPNGTFPHWPRRPDGRPAGIGLPITEDDPELAQAEREAEERMPTGLHYQRTPEGNHVLVDLTPRYPDGEPIIPPDLPPTP
jgi:hypothetical protein